MVLLCWQLGAGNNVGTLSWQVSMVGLVLSCLPAKSEGGGDESRHFLRQLSKAKARQEPPLLQQRVRHAWLFPWGSMLACSGARALALSLLDVRAGQGVDGPTPLGDDVVWTPGTSCECG